MKAYKKETEEHMYYVLFLIFSEHFKKFPHIRIKMQKKGIVGLVLIVSLLLIWKDFRRDIVFQRLITDISLMSENTRNQETVKCENFEVSVNMLKHPCGQTIKEDSVSSITVNISHSEKSIDRMNNFEKIYETNIWGSNGESKSGLGSTKDNTRQILKILNNVVNYLKLELQQERIR